jgi:hypothetical protein
MIQSPPRHVFRRTFGSRLELCLAVFVGANLLLAVWPGTETARLTYALGVVAIFAACAALWVRTGRTVLAIYGEGTRQASFFRERELLWNEIAEYRCLIVSNQLGVVRGLTRIVSRNVEAPARGMPAGALILTLVGRSGDRIRVPPSFEHAEQAIEIIVQEIHSRIKPELKARLAQGEEISFGRLGLSLRGVSWWGRERIPATEIGKVEISGTRLYIRHGGKLLPFTLSVSTEKIPNALLALELLQELRVNAGLGGVAEAFA